MSFFDDNQTSDSSYHFIDGSNPDALLAELAKPKRHFDEPPHNEPPHDKPRDEVAPTPADEVEKKTEPTESELKRQAKPAAKFVVGAIDGGLSYLSALLAESGDSSLYRADKDERDQLTELWAEYLKDKGGDLPPGMMLLLMTVIVYGPKLKKAWDDRAHNRLIAEQRAKLEAREQEIADLRIEIEKQRLEFEQRAQQNAQQEAGKEVPPGEKEDAQP
jgi:hypothetical protein